MEMMSSNKEDAVDQVEEEGPLPGFRFHPTDEELVSFYLRRKVENKPISIEIIKEIDIYKHDPWELTRASSTGDKVWYFYCQRGRKYKNSIRPNRVTGSGFWKATGIDKPICSNGGGCIGLKKTLVFYRGSAGKGTKTDWMMHEFRHPSEPQHSCSNPRDTLQEAEIWTLCRILKRNQRHSQDLKGTSANKTSTELASSSKPIHNKERFISFVNQTTEHCQPQQHYETGNRKNNDPNSANVVARQNEKGIICLAGSSCSTEIRAQHPEVAMAQTTFPSSGDDEGEQFLGGNSWEDLSSVVEFATRSERPHHGDRRR